MVKGSGIQPSPKDKAKYLAKIDEWQNLGFDVTGLADLLETDFEMFKKRRLEILRGQISSSPDESARVPKAEPEIFEEEPEEVEPEIPEEPTEEEEEEVPEEVPTILVSTQAAGPRTTPASGSKEDLVLVGKPLPVEPPPPDDSETILVGDIEEEAKGERREAREEVGGKEAVKKAAKVREIEAEARGERREAKVEDEEVGIPSPVAGAEVPPEKEVKAKEEKEPGQKAADSEERGRSQAGRVVAIVIVGIVIMTSLWWMMFTHDPEPDGGNGNGPLPELDAVIFTDKTTALAGETINFNAQDSKGDIASYQWDFDTDFKKTLGSDTSVYVAGYFAQSGTDTENYQVTLTVKTAGGRVDSESIDITIDPYEVTVAEEMLGDTSTFRVSGNITITNPDNIASITMDSGIEQVGDVTADIDKIVLNFVNPADKPMTTDLMDAGQKENGFMHLHDVYSRDMEQDVDISGTMHAQITTSYNEFEENVPIEGSMQTSEVSYTDYSTDQIIQIASENVLDLIAEIDDPLFSVSMPMNSNDKLTSYPNLRQMSSRLQLADLSDEPIGLGDSDTVKYGSVAYSWFVLSADQVLGTPALKLEFHLDSGTLKANNIDEFTMYIWLGDNKPVPLKSDVHVELTSDDNQVVMNYANILTEYTAGTISIEGKTCDEEFDSSRHYPVKFPFNSTMQDEFTDDWNYLPNLTKTNLENSFSGFSPDLAMARVLAQPGFTNFLADNPEAYVINGNCSEKEGELLWNLTFSSADSTAGYNILVGKSGVKHEMDEEVSGPKNSTDDFWPILTFAGSEYILKAYNDGDINLNIFQNDKINFEEVVYGVTAGLDYPTVDLTSVTNFQSSKLSYYAIKEEEYGWFSCAMDAETGQLMFKWEHQYAGVEMPY